MAPPPKDELRISQEDWFKLSKVAAGGFTFVLALSGFQCMQGLACISAAHPLASALGLVSVGAGSFLSSLAADQAPTTLCKTMGWAPPTPWTRKIASGKDLLSPEAFSSLWQDPDQKKEKQMLRALRAAMMGIVIFKGLGGRFLCVAPSDVARPGAFFRMKGSLPATLEYANQVEKRALDGFGAKFGCHSCGRKEMVQYIGDHMPPKKVAMAMNRKWWRRLFNKT